jgi:hypothetical protein
VSPPEDKNIRKWYEEFRETGIVENRHSAEWLSQSDEDVDCVRL